MHSLSRVDKKPPIKIETRDTDTNPSFSLKNLPVELQAKIFSNLKLQDLERVRMVSRDFRDVAQIKPSWENIAKSMRIDADDFVAFREEIKVYANNTITVWEEIVEHVNQRDLVTINNPDFEELKKENSLEKIERFGKWIETNKEIDLLTLYLVNLKIKYLPNAIVNLRKLKELSLNSNELTTLPEDIGLLKNLTKLDLTYNKLKILPESIEKNEQLTGLYLFDNQLEALPDKIGKCKNLSEVVLSSNKLKTLPKSIKDLNNLTILMLCDNQLTTISLGNISKLKQFSVAGNDLDKLPFSSIEEVPKLKRLDISKKLEDLEVVKKLEEKEKMKIFID